MFHLSLPGWLKTSYRFYKATELELNLQLDLTFKIHSCKEDERSGWPIWENNFYETILNDRSKKSIEKADALWILKERFGHILRYAKTLCNMGAAKFDKRPKTKTNG